MRTTLFTAQLVILFLFSLILVAQDKKAVSEKIDNIKGNMIALEAQVNTIEDILELFHDQMLTIKSPKEISGELNELITNIQLTQEAIEETDSFMNEFKKLEQKKENLQLKE